MGKKKVKANVKIQMEAGKATPAPPVGTALGPHGVIGRVRLGALDRLGHFLVLLASSLRHQANTSIPSERAVPSIIFIAASTS